MKNLFSTAAAAANHNLNPLAAIQQGWANFQNRAKNGEYFPTCP